MSREDVIEAIIKPMRDEWMPGSHIKGNQEAQSRKLERLIKKLERFDRATLEKAFDKVASDWKMTVWPPTANFETAAKIFQPKTKSEAEQKLELAMEMKDAKTREYRKKSSLYKQAKRDGWAGSLGSFIDEQIWIQAQVLAGCKGIGFSSHLAELIHPDKHYASSSEAYQDIRKWMGTRFVEEKKLIVKPPRPSLISKWKDQAKTRTAGPMAETFREVIEQKKHNASSAEVGG